MFPNIPRKRPKELAIVTSKNEISERLKKVENGINTPLENCIGTSTVSHIEKSAI